MRIAALFGLGTLLSIAGCGPGGPDGSVALEGTWRGDLETGYLPSGSSLVVVEIERAEVGEPVVARIVFGEGAAPAAPTDPEVGWPAQIDPQMAGVPVADGFSYASLGGTRTGDRLTIDVAVTDLWAPWCEIQTPHQIASGSDEAQCLPNRPWLAGTAFGCVLPADGDDPEVTVDCLKLTLCRRTRVCACTGADGCMPSRTGLTMRVELTVTGDTAVGNILWTSEDPEVGNQIARIRLQRL